MNGDTTRLRREAAEFNNQMKLTMRKSLAGGPATRARFTHSRLAAYLERSPDTGT